MMNKPAVYKIKETSIIENIEYPIFKTNEIQCEEISDTAVQTIKPLVSVGMITYNHEPYIAQAIEGVLNQKTDFPFELVIGEDCSTDRTREIVLEYRNKHPDIIRVLVAEENVGAIRNLKRTLSACRGKYIAYCEGDDYWHHPLKLQKQADYLESHPDVGLIHSDVDCHFAASGKIARNRFANHPMVRSPREGAPLIENLITGEYIVMTSSVMARHALIDEVFTACAHEFSEEFLRGDIQMWIEIAYRSKFAYIEEALATYLVLTESASNSKNPYNIYRFWSKGIEIKLHYLQKYCDKSIRQLRTIVLKDYIREILRLAFRYRKPDIAQEALCRAEEEQIDLEILDTMYLHASNSPFFFYLMHTIRMVRKIGGKVYSILWSVFLTESSRNDSVLIVMTLPHSVERRRMIRKAIRRACQSGLLGFYYSSDFPIRTCFRWRMLRHERATIEYLAAFLKPGNVFVDVGAHIGYFAEYAGRLVGRTGRVFAFEPHPSNYKMLVRNCRHMTQIKIIQAAVSDSSGQALLFEHSSSSSSHALTDLSGSGKTIPIRKISLDEWAHTNKVPRMDVVLIDVEGHESSVLRGMRYIIENNSNIIIIMEYCPSNWTSRREEMDLLIEEMHKMQLYVTCALGQSKKYAIAEYTSENDLSDRLAVILDEEINVERCDYVNIILRRRV